MSISEKRQASDEIEVTPEMTEAGGIALIKSRILSSPFRDIDDAVTDVYDAMKAAARKPEGFVPTG